LCGSISACSQSKSESGEHIDPSGVEIGDQATGGQRESVYRGMERRNWEMTGGTKAGMALKAVRRMS
jgi:hypothetical protein